MSAILFPTDFSPTATNAFLYALNLAKVFKSTIKLITLNTHSNTDQNLSEDQFNEKVNQLKLLATEANFGEIELSAHLEFGDLLLTLLEITKNEDIRYIVMGTNGENNLNKKVFGSMTLSVISNANVPVLAIPHHVKYKKERKFAFATLFDDKEDYALTEMLAITKAHHGHLNVVHVEKGLPSSATILNREEWISNHPNVNLEIVQSKFVDDALINYCQVNKTDVLGIVRRDLNFFQRIFSEKYSEQLLTNADFAILVFRGHHHIEA